MSNLLFSTRGALLAAALGTALALSACGGSGNSSGGDTPPVAGTPTTPPFASDSFFDYVSARAYSLLEIEEPESIDAVTETKPENTEPKPVG